MSIQISSAAETQLLALAQAAGTQAFVWVGSLAALMLLCAALFSGHALLRMTTPGSGKANALPGRTLREGGLAYVLAVAIGSFAVIAWLSRAGSVFADVDRVFSQAAHANAPAWLLQASSLTTHLGDGLVLSLVCIVGVLGLFARREPVLAFGLAVAMGGNGVLNALLKHWFARSRPPQPQGVLQFHGSGFPSSHASASLVAYGMLTYLLLCLLPPRWHMALVCWAAALVLIVGASRVFLGAHYTSDVIAGFASGMAWLSLCVLAVAVLRRRAIVWPDGLASKLSTARSRSS
jgi:undecaprenyl-diphosphatase